MENNYLAHYGTLGQKWGLRRWQNYDGSLTPAGREHYGVGAPKPNEPSTPKERTELANQVRKQYKKRGGEHHTVAADIVFHKVKKSAKAYIDAKKKLDGSSSNAKQDVSKLKKAAKKAEADYNSDVRDWVDKCVGKHGNEVISNKWESKRMSDALSDTVKDEYLKAEVNDRVYDAFFKDSAKNGKKSTESPEEFIKSYEEKIKTDKNFAKEFSREYYERQRDNARKIAKSQKELDKMIEILDREEKYEGFKVNDPYYLRNAILELKGEEYRELFGEKRKANKKLVHAFLSDEKDDHLEHHGIPGQKWYLRRFQNEDGSLTPEGRKRYGVGEAREGSGDKPKKPGLIERYKQKKEEKRKAAEKAARVQKMKEGKARKAAERKAAEEHEAAKTKAIQSGNAEEVAKFRSELSYQELNDALNRIDLEKKLNERVEAMQPKAEPVNVDTRTRLEKATDLLDKYGNMANKVSGSAENFIKLYNTTAKVMNTFTDTDWPTIEKTSLKDKIEANEKKRKEREAEEHKKWVDDLIKKNDPEEIDRNSDKLTNDELNAAIRRLNYNEQIQNKIKARNAATEETAEAAQETEPKKPEHLPGYEERKQKLAIRSEVRKELGKRDDSSNGTAAAIKHRNFNELVSNVMKDREEGKDYDNTNPDFDASNAWERHKTIRFSKRR